MNTSIEWLRIHTLTRWLTKLRRDPPEPAATPALAPLRAAERLTKIAWLEDHIATLRAGPIFPLVSWPGR